MTTRQWRLGAASVAGAAGVGGSVAVGAIGALNPWLALAAAIGVASIALGVVFARALPTMFLGALGFILVGYAFFGKSFAYLGVAPLYIGELVLVLGILTLLVSGGLHTALRSWLVWLLIAFGAWGAARTIPYIGTYRLDALRDAVVWGYGLFAVFIAALLPRTGLIARIPAWYRRLMPWFVVWVPTGWLVGHFFGDRMPMVPGTDHIALIEFKSGDAGVHLAGIAAFVVLGLHQQGARRRGNVIRATEWLVWVFWLVGFLFAAATNRGGALASICAVLTVTLLRPAAARRKIPVVAVLAIVLALAISVSNATSWSVVDRDREVSPGQIIVNLKSIVGGGGGEALEGSRRWRLAWWTRITEYTLFGDFFWTGKGFGVNLADDDGFQVTRDHSLRSPHNAHVMLLARTGVPGVTLWLILQGAFAISMIDAYFRARRARRERWSQLSLWVLAYWVAFMVNATFDVFLEGPQGGIWFWSLVGLGIVIIQMSRDGFGPVPAPAAAPVAERVRVPAWTGGAGVRP
ncbi:MAG TPA: O-antigen ligase family protein [Gemmatimonadaceae bacterium]